jgi:hypothetical protein
MHAFYHAIDLVFERRANIVWKYVTQVSSLVISLVWMANALANRPASGGTWNEVRDAGSVHRATARGEVEPYRPLGWYMLHSLVETPAYRLSGLRTIDMNSILRLVFSKGRNSHGSQADLYLMLNPVHQRDTQGGKRSAPLDWGDEPALVSIPRASGTSNKRRRRIIVAPDAPAPDIFGPGPGQVAIPGFDEQDEEECTSEEEDDEERQQGSVTYKELSELIHRVAVQIFSKVPNHQSGASYCRLTEGEKSAITNSVFKVSTNLAATWWSYTVYTDAGKWQNTVNRLFPTCVEYQEMNYTKDGKRRTVQGLPSMEFWTTWQVVLRRVPPKLQKSIVNAVRNHVHSTWRWFPAIEGGKLFNTGGKGKNHFGDWSTGPWIACNPRFQT